MKFNNRLVVVVAQSLSRVWLFETPLTAECPASLSFTISRSLLKLMSIESVMPSNRLILCRPLLLPPSVFPGIRVFSVSRLFASGDQSIGASASAAALPVNIQGWFPLGLTSLISLLSKDSQESSPEQFFSTQSSLWPNSHIRTWLLEQLWLFGPLSAKWCLYFLIHCLGLS